jgi:hypothetical protein
MHLHSDLGEASRLYHAIWWIHDLQLTNIDFEVDSKRVAYYFKQGNGDITEFSVIMDSNIQYCNLYLTNSHVELTRRQTNEVAYELAKTATSLTFFFFFFESAKYY